MKTFLTFIDVADAFGSVFHKFIYESLEMFNILKVYKVYHDLIFDQIMSFR